MNIRKLKIEDAPRMLEWMHEDAAKYFRFDFSAATLETTRDFIRRAQKETANLHLAVTDDNDNYMGTVSLKEIDRNNHNAEYAISLHADARGHGYAHFATDAILSVAFKQLHLHRVYLNVLSDNERAIHFYRKYGFKFEGEFRDCLFLSGTYRSLQWYSMLDDAKEIQHDS